MLLSTNDTTINQLYWSSKYIVVCSPQCTPLVTHQKQYIVRIFPSIHLMNLKPSASWSPRHSLSIAPITGLKYRPFFKRPGKRGGCFVNFTAKSINKTPVEIIIWRWVIIICNNIIKMTKYNTLTVPAQPSHNTLTITTDAFQNIHSLPGGLATSKTLKLTIGH